MKAYLILADGTVFEGESIGAAGEVVGEAVFTTGMGGYMETLTDPCYYGQLVVQTFPIIGNYGSVEEDVAGKTPRLSGYVVRELCPEGNNYRMDGALDDYLRRKHVAGIAGVDTRELTRKIRETGVMNAMISDNVKNLPEKIKTIKKYRVAGAVAATSAHSVERFGEGDLRVALWDFGASDAMLDQLVSRGLKVIRMPYTATADEILAQNPDGIVLSDGGGDPADNPGIIAQLVKLGEKKLPTFGVSLGHQLLALSKGAETKKLRYGHRGGNQPVKDLASGRVYVTSQNHGYVVRTNSLPDSARQTFINVNDRTCEGIEYTDCPAFSVQFYPEPSGGPQNTGTLYDRFIELMRGEHHA